MKSKMNPRHSATPVMISMLLLATYVLHAQDNDWQIVGNNMFSLPTGNVGIGTNAPVSKLHIFGSSDPVTNGTPVGIRIGLLNLQTSSTTNWGILNHGNLFFTTSDVASPTLTLSSVTGNVGIGTSNPTLRFQVTGGDIGIDNDSRIRNNSFVGDFIEFRQAEFRFFTRGRVLFDICEKFGSIPDEVHIGDGGDVNTTIRAANASGIGVFVRGSDGHVGINTTQPGSFTLAVEGKIGAREFEVTNVSPYPDYVFSDEYNLMPLEEVECFIDSLGHLPGIPSAQEVDSAGGVNVGEMQLKLLEKVEELTLYQIQLNKKLLALQRENAELRNMVLGR